MGVCCGKPNAVASEGLGEFAAADHASPTGLSIDAFSKTAIQGSYGQMSPPSASSTDRQLTDSVPAYYSKSAVKVAVVVRPLLQPEVLKESVDCVSVGGNSDIVLPQRFYPGGTMPAAEGANVAFNFDRVYKGQGISQMLLGEMTEPVIRQFLKGFNATVFAYGQTGSGKTYTMGTALSSKQVVGAGEKSIIPRALHIIFEALTTITQEYNTIMKVVYVEIHEDTIKDLLVDQSTPRVPSITLREHPIKGVYMDNAREVEVKALADVAQALELGNSRRTVAAHNLNEFSSRSHAVLQLTLEQKRKSNAASSPDKHKFLQSKLNLVDLAGSERAKDTGTVGQQFHEGVHINQGLLALGNVIGALTEGTNRKHIPYRDSKLTRILQDSLGGTSETLMIACISPADCNLEQTINTLKYASRARKIQNKLKLNNKLCLEDELAFLKKSLAEKDNLIRQLQQENTQLRAKH